MIKKGFNVGTTNKYELIDILGKGTFSTVWEAKVVKSKTLEVGNIVAVKIQKLGQKNEDSSLDEISILRKLKRNTSNKYIIKLIDDFEIEDKQKIIKKTIKGKRGKYRHIYDDEVNIRYCAVFDKLGDNLYDVVKNTYKNGYITHKKSKSSIKISMRNRRLPISIVKHITRQMLDGIVFLHSQGIIHTDLKLENLLVKTKIEKYADFNISDFDITIVDFGNACYQNNLRSDYVQTLEYRAPECILGYNYNSKIDIWSIGCIVFELLTGCPLFPLSSNPRVHIKNKYDHDDDILSSSDSDNKTSRKSPRNIPSKENCGGGGSGSDSGSDSEDDEDDLITFIHLYKIQSMIGNLPIEKYKQLEKYKSFYNRYGELRHFHPQTILERSLRDIMHHDYFYKKNDAKKIEEFLLNMIRWNESERKSAQELLNEPWLKNE